MEQRKRRWGDRYDGRRIRTLPPMNYVSPFIMKSRSDSFILFQNTLEIHNIERFIWEKRKEGLAGFGFMHTIVAAYVRLVSQRPAFNRFISGQRIYQHDDIILSMMVKKSLELNAQETGIKVVFSPSDTVYDVYHKMEEAIRQARIEGDSTALDNLARTLVRLPAPFLRGFVGLMNIMDYFGIMPKFAYRASPFHASFFISNLGSIGLPAAFHHLYNFGNIPLFITFGTKYSRVITGHNGEQFKRKYIDYTVSLDERIADGHYMASGLKYMDYLLKHLYLLNTPPETIVRDVD